MGREGEGEGEGEVEGDKFSSSRLVHGNAPHLFHISSFNTPHHPNKIHNTTHHYKTPLYIIVFNEDIQKPTRGRSCNTNNNRNLE